jgi:5,10-methylenetetrahydromethanopterin reductase
VLFAAAADKTERIRFGPNVTHVFLREPTLICQQVATLDELTGGRTELVVSTGNFGLLAQYGIDWANQKPLSRLKEAIHVMRTFLDEGAITFEGRFYRYSGLFTMARPVQQRVPLLIGAMRGPRSFEVAGEISDGTHSALNYSREAFDYMVEHMRVGAERAGRDWRELDIGAWCVFVVGPDSAKAKLAAQTIGAFYVPAMPHEQLERHGISQADVKPILDAFAAGDVQRAIDEMSPELAKKLSIAGTPAEIVEKIRDDIAPTGVNHMILCVTDAHLVKAFTGRDVEVPDAQAQLRLVAEEIMPSFAMTTV